MRILAPLAIVCVAVGCGNTSTAPSSLVAGNWGYYMTNLQGIGSTGDTIICRGMGVLGITGRGSTFNGTYSYLRVYCSNGTAPSQAGPLNGIVVNGTLSGNSVTFYFDSSSYVNFGTFSDTAMSGILSSEWKFGAAGNVMLVGNWSAFRAPSVSPLARARGRFAP